MRYYAGIGARTTPPAMLELMTRVARVLAAKGYTLRSGHAEGADSAFEAGAGGLCEIFLPARGWRGSASALHPRSIDPALWARARGIAARAHPAFARLTPFVQALHTRNAFQILGRDLENLSEFVLCWTADGEASGGTGQALRIAASSGIPAYNLNRPRERAHVARHLGL